MRFSVVRVADGVFSKWLSMSMVRSTRSSTDSAQLALGPDERVQRVFGEPIAEAGAQHVHAVGHRGELGPVQRDDEAVALLAQPQAGAGARQQRRHADRRHGRQLRAGGVHFGLLGLGELSVQGDAELVASASTRR